MKFSVELTAEEMTSFLEWQRSSIFLPHLRDKKIEDVVSIRAGTDLTVSIAELGLSVRVQNCLRAEGIDTLGELIRHSYSDLMKLPGMGKHTVREVINALFARGLCLRPPANL